LLLESFKGNALPLTDVVEEEDEELDEIDDAEELEEDDVLILLDD